MNYAQLLIADIVYAGGDVRCHEVRISKMKRNWSRCTVFI